MKQELIDVLIFSSYHPHGHGWRKITETKTHWVTSFANGTLQMYGYMTDDEEMEKEYDTGYIIVPNKQAMQILVNVLTADHG